MAKTKLRLQTGAETERRGAVLDVTRQLLQGWEDGENQGRVFQSAKSRESAKSLKGETMTKDSTAKKVISGEDLHDAIFALPSVQPLTDRFTKLWARVPGAASKRRETYYSDTIQGRPNTLLPNCCEQQRHWCQYLGVWLSS